MVLYAVHGPQVPHTRLALGLLAHLGLEARSAVFVEQRIAGNTTPRQEYALHAKFKDLELVKRVHIAVGSFRNSYEQILQFTLHAQSCLPEETTFWDLSFQQHADCQTHNVSCHANSCVCVAEPVHVIYPLSQLAVVSIDTL